MTFPYLFLSLTLHLITSSAAEDWCYDIQKQNMTCAGPSEWQHTFEYCAQNKQSPINIVTCVAELDSNLKPFQFKGYDEKNSFKLTNNGHSAELELENTIEISGGGLSGTYTAKQLHFHWGSENNHGSEHSLNGEKYPIELHIVHEKKTGERSESSGGSNPTLAVLGFFFKEGLTNKNYENLIEGFKSIPENGNSTKINDVKLQDLIPTADKLELFYRYEGSLTTPSCDEIVTWTVFPATVELDKDQIKAFYTTLKYKSGQYMEQNFRPIQKRNDRTIYTSGVDVILPHTRYLLIPLFVFYLTSVS